MPASGTANVKLDILSVSGYDQLSSDSLVKRNKGVLPDSSLLQEEFSFSKLVPLVLKALLAEPKTTLVGYTRPGLKGLSESDTPVYRLLKSV